jgi:hypothetical protein
MTGYRGRVHIGGVAVSGRIARLVLLGCTLFGLAAMHTIGHSGVHGGKPHGSPAVATVLTVATSIVAPDDCDCDHAATAAQPLRGAGMGGWELCVAVLSAFAIAMLLVALLLAAATGRHSPRSARGRRPAPRAPPGLPFGLTLATVSVLRT